MNNKRELVLDTETTGIQWEIGHKILEIGIVELIDRKKTGHTFHCYLEPDRVIEDEVVAIHGLDNDTIAELSGGKRFGDIYDDLISFIAGSDLVIHNASFDMGHLDAECRRINKPIISGTVSITDTLLLANRKHPGKKNNLDALSRRYGMDNRDRTYHGALLDSEILSDVYVEMTRSQNGLDLSGKGSTPTKNYGKKVSIDFTPTDPSVSANLMVVNANDDEVAVHKVMTSNIAKSSKDSEFSF